MNNLEGKVVAILGSTGGVGDPIAEEFVRAGAKVLLGARRFPELSAQRDRIDPTGKNSIAQPTDASVSGQVTNLLEAGAKRFGRVDIVLVTVGTWRLTSINTELDKASEAARVLVDSIIIPSWNAIFEAQQFLSKQGGGTIINMSSWVAINEPDKKEGKLGGNIYYRAAKVAVENMVESLRLVTEDKLIFINLRPALVDTPINRRENPKITDEEWKLAVQPKQIFDWIVENWQNPKDLDPYFHSELIL